MLPEKSNSDNYAGNILWGIIFVFAILQVYKYVSSIYKKEDSKNYEAIIAEKDLIIEEQQRQLERQLEIIRSLK